MKGKQRFFVLIALLMAACSPLSGMSDVKPMAVNAPAAALGDGFGALLADAKVCGIHVLQKGASGSGDPHPVTLWAATEICGGYWHAVGMQAQAPGVYVRSGGTASYDQSANTKADVLADATGAVYVRQGGTMTKVASLAGNRITPLPTVTFEMTVNGRPYQVGDPKATPDSDKAIFVTLAQ